jgi:shikimate kinase
MIGPPPARIVLVGMMGSGKTTVAKAIGARLGWKVLDNDAQIRAATGRDGPAIFREGGEDALHQAEEAAFLRAINEPGPSVVTVAASVVDDPAHRDRLRAGGHVVWLRARPATLHRRIASGAGRRSDAVDEAWLTRLSREREPRYAEVADQVVDVDDQSVAGVADAVIAAIGAASAG